MSGDRQMKKNDITEVYIEDFTKTGEGIGHIDGYTLFVKDALIGDRVRAVITRPKKHYAYAKALEITEPSPDRTGALCPCARQCGGCNFQEYSYEAQLRWKRRYVEQTLRKIGGFENLEVRDVLGMEKPFRYRNKAQYPVAEIRTKSGETEIAAGFYAGHTHYLVPVRDCLLTDRGDEEILDIILEHMRRFHVKPYDETDGSGLVRHILIRRGKRSGQILVCIIINGRNVPGMASLAEKLGQIEGMTSVSLNVNRKPGNVIMGDEIIPVLGDPWISDQLGDLIFRISPKSFYQVNPEQTEVLYGEACRAAGLTGRETVFDLYCGIGTISLRLAREAAEVYGVEIVPQAIQDAKQNARLNRIGNAHFYAGAAEELVVRGYFEEGVPLKKPDVVVVDPPRKGCDGKLLDTILKLEPRRIVYVSCDPATLARDLRILSGGGYRPEYVLPVDMFPQTSHVETVCVLSKLSEAKHHISVQVDMDELDLTSAEAKATYKEIQDWVQEKYGFHVTNLNIAQVKQKHGIIERENYNKPKTPDSKQPGCPEDKIKAIEDAMRNFQMI